MEEKLLKRILDRVQYLADLPMNQLRAHYPAATDTEAELIRHCRESGYTRGMMVSAILEDEFEPNE